MSGVAIPDKQVKIYQTFLPLDGMDGQDGFSIQGIQGIPGSGDSVIGPIDVPFNAGDFTANGAMTWTVGAGSLLGFFYKTLGNFIDVYIELVNTTIGGVLDTQLYIKIPNAKLASRSTFGLFSCSAFPVQPVVGNQALIAVFTGSDKIILQWFGPNGVASNWVASNNTSIFGFISIPF